MLLDHRPIFILASLPSSCGLQCSRSLSNSVTMMGTLGYNGDADNDDAEDDDSEDDDSEDDDEHKWK